VAEEVRKFAISRLGEEHDTIVADRVSKFFEVAEAFAVLLLDFIAELLFFLLERVELVEQGGLGVVECGVGEEALGVLEFLGLLIEGGDLLVAFADDACECGRGHLGPGFEDDIAKERDLAFNRIPAGGLGLFDRARDGCLERLAGDEALGLDLLLAFRDFGLELDVCLFELGFELLALGANVGDALVDNVDHLGAEVFEFAVPGFLVDFDDHVLGEVEDALEVARGHVEKQPQLARGSLDEPDVADRAGEFDVAHALAANLGAGDFDAALVADDALVADALVLAAVALEVLGGAEDLLAEESVLFGLQGAVVDGLWLGDFAVGPGADLLRAGKGDPHLVEIIDFEH